MGGMMYVECDVPAGMTLMEWRRAKRFAAPPTRRPRRPALLRLRAASLAAAGLLRVR
jgi:hypothetical protein